MPSRPLKNLVYSNLARVGQALASPTRIELLDLLAQGEKTVERLAEESACPVKNTSAHLRVLRQGRLVEVRRQGTFIHYRLAGPAVGRLLGQLHSAGRQQLAEVEHDVRRHLDDRDGVDAVSLPELRVLLREGRVTLLDVRPHDEFLAGHLPGARSIPKADLGRRLGELSKGREIIAYCRGPYCIYALEAVTLLRRRGFKARRADAGFPEWQHAGLAVMTGAA